MARSNEQIVRDFCSAWARRDADELLGFFTDDAVYHNIPMPPVAGKAAIREVFNLFLPPAQKIEFEMLHLAVAGNVVFTERVDRFVLGAADVELPVAGVFEIEDGRIKAWRDYFDMATWQRQTAVG
ncbi:MAG TPA: limonene-1,2-epoxide hydrolase family protein [Candidatus Binatia bacterium]|jgi:limonene-1,2-epoxide hydrolase